jgi:hypothetical protein
MGKNLIITGFVLGTIFTALGIAAIVVAPNFIRNVVTSVKNK